MAGDAPLHVRTDLGYRVELVPMDTHFHEISVGLYRCETEDGPVGLVHSYSGRPGTPERLPFIAQTMRVLGGLEEVPGEPAGLRLSCRAWHNAALRRLFLDAFRVDPTVAPEPRPLEAPDTRSDQFIRVEPLGGGAYRVHAEGATADTPSRAPAIARALLRLAQLDPLEGDETGVAFDCGYDHHALVGLLLVRAQNLRAALREEELSAARGVLAAPSAQE
jgi:hypothetical protein